MCEKCAEFDKRIAHHRALSMRTTDQLTLEGIAVDQAVRSAEARVAW